MAKKIKYPIGIQTFSEIISEGYLYVDKTKTVYELANDNKYVFLSRPRRFGKSLLMSTLESYFKGERELFRGLEIEKLESDWTSYPVFRFDFSVANYIEPQRLIDHIGASLRRIETDYSLPSHATNISERFIDLIENAYKCYGKKVVILIDEYDKPLLDCLDDSGLHDKIKSELRSFFAVIKGCDRFIRFAMLSGITKFGKVSVFSGLNNLRDISLLPKYNAVCGISESEFRNNFTPSISIFAEAHGISQDDAWQRFRTMYDGYHFASRGEFIYNPFSVLNAFNDEDLMSYWYSSGSPAYLIKLIEKNNYRLDRLDGVRKNEIELSDISDISQDFVPLLYQSGYLTIKGYDSESAEYILGFPNHEVNKAFWSSLANRFFRRAGGEPAFSVRECVKDINEGNAEAFMLKMKSLFADTSSVPERNKEVHFQNMMAIAAKMMGLMVRTEVHSGSGRCDMQILTDRYVYIFEFKIDGTVEEAIAQINRKQYVQPFAADSRTIIMIGANFSTKTRTLGDWIIIKETH